MLLIWLRFTRCWADWIWLLWRIIICCLGILIGRTIFIILSEKVLLHEINLMLQFVYFFRKVFDFMFYFVNISVNLISLLKLCIYVVWFPVILQIIYLIHWQFITLFYEFIEILPANLFVLLQKFIAQSIFPFVSELLCSFMAYLFVFGV